MKKLVLIILAALSLVFVACSPSSDTEGTTESTTAEEVAETKYVEFITSGKTEYRIIYPSNNTDADAAFRLSSLFSLALNANVAVKKDTLGVASEKEIVIGKTNREEIANEYHSKLIADAYFIKLENNILFISAASAEGYEAAFNHLFSQYLGIEDINNMNKPNADAFKLPENLERFCEPTVKLEENKTASGDKYSVDGSENTMYNYFVSKEKLEYTFESLIADSFNTYEIVYSSTTPAVAHLKYIKNGALYEEECFLEEGYHKTFRSFTDGALSEEENLSLSSIAVSMLDGKEMTFRLEDVILSKRELPEELLYIEDGNYKLGIKLSWGGGVSYLEDLRDSDESISNLLNDHDTGRLVQQSYYGTNKAPYECGTYNGQQWGYNPVQGGDQYNNRSKLIDYEISVDKKSVYVKCRPLDWAKKNSLTPSYMENTYTLCDGYVKVDNRFTDFSGYTHRNAHQELPAFYTISYLSEFVCYTGKQAWKNGELTVKKDMAFWAGNPDAYIALNSKETWCAWCAPNGYGVGVYTPIAEQLLAGRFSYNGSKDASNNATNYVAPLITKTLKTFEPFEYSYYITTGSAEEIRAQFSDIAQGNK